MMRAKIIGLTVKASGFRQAPGMLTRRMRWMLPIAMLLLQGCGDTPSCSSEQMDLTRDPSSDLFAVTEVRNCGATTDYATIIRVGRGAQTSGGSEEVFVGDTDHGAAAERGNALWTSVVWTAPRHLSIVYAVRGRVFKRVSAANGAAITYRADDLLRSPPVP